MNMKRINYAAYNEAGLIIGLYNSEDHRDAQIPAMRISITQQQHAEIVRRPQDFSVDINAKRLHDNKRNKHATMEVQEVEISEVRQRIACGFMHNEICYWADEAASDHITQCLSIAAFDKDFKPVLKATVDGEVDYVKVDHKDLLAIAKGVNALRIGL